MARDDASRAIGKIVSVSADRLIVELHRGSDNFTIVGFDDIHYVATLGSYLMVPMQAEHIVLEIIGLREKDSASSQEKTARRCPVGLEQPRAEDARPAPRDPCRAQAAAAAATARRRWRGC